MPNLKSLLAVSCLISLAACATTPAGYYPGGAAMRGVADSQEGFGTSALVRCQVPEYHALTPVSSTVRPGDTVTLHHTFSFGPYGQQHIPLHCVNHWQIEPPEAATLSADRRTLHVSGDAVPGSAITITVTANNHRHTLTLPVVRDSELHVLGNWRALPGQACYSSPAPREIHFGQDGVALFALGTGPGTWNDRREFTFDPATGVLTLNGESGTAHLDDDGHLVITGLRLPSATAPLRRLLDAEGNYEEIVWATCQLTFSRTSTYR
ncbi:MAG: hypothetical protein ACK4NO_06050 [Glycocaulis sp.]